jgi:ribosomal protein L25 (general stress protein Ctc)
MEAPLQAVKREREGKNEARGCAPGRIPAVVYGAQKAGERVAPVPSIRSRCRASCTRVGREHADHALKVDGEATRACW